MSVLPDARDEPGSVPHGAMPERSSARAIAPEAGGTMEKEIAPRAVYCPVEHARRDSAVAESVRAGRFRHAGITVELGAEPDWLRAQLPADPEWRIEWVKFYYGLDLAFAYATSGDGGFLATWERLVASWIRQVPPDHDRSEIAARRVQNWIYAWMHFAAAPQFRGLGRTLAGQIIESVGGQLAHVRQTLSAERNHRTLELYALLVGALAFPVLDLCGELRDFALAELHRNLLEDVLPDGVHRERSSHYHMVALRSFVGARENARRFGLTLPAGYDERLSLACEFAAHCHRPDGQIPMLSDSDAGTYGDVLALAAELLGRPDFLWPATRGQLGAPPARRCASFPAGGYFTQRSGWGNTATPYADERWLIFDCGPVGDGGHGHYDALSVEIAACGRSLLVDPGRYSYAEPSDVHAPDWGRWFKGTAAHNTVCVDGLDQTRYGRGKPKGPPARARLLDRGSAPGVDVLWGEVQSEEYTALHRRHVIFVHDEYWIIADRVRDARPRRYDLRFHLPSDAHERTRLVRRDGDWMMHAPGLALVLVSAREPRVEQGWVAPIYGEKQHAPVLSVVDEGADEAEFITLVLPMREGDSVPTVRVRHMPTGDVGPLDIEVEGVSDGARQCDRVTWHPPHDRTRTGRRATPWITCIRAERSDDHVRGASPGPRP